MTNTATKITAILAALILLIGAAIHLKSLPSLGVEIADVDSAFYKNSLTAMWIVSSFHWIFIAFLSVGLSRYRSNSCAAILMAFGVMILVETLITLQYVGGFRGLYMLGEAGVLLLASGLMLRREMRKS